jgi:hypothetical protein
MMNLEIESVEYPADEYPPTFVGFDYSEGMPNFLRLLVDDEPEADERVRIFWSMPHQITTTLSTIPKSHDHIISLGCEGYGLLLKSVKVANAALLDMAALRTLMTTDLDFTGAEAALGFSVAALTDYNLPTTGDISKAEAVWDEEKENLRTFHANQMDAEQFLTDGSLRLNKFNKGRQVPEQYALYAEKMLDMARLWAERRKDFLVQIERRLQASQAASTEASQWIAEQNTKVAAAEKYVGNVTQGLAATQVYRQDGLERISRFKDELKNLRQTSHKRRAQSMYHNIWLED